MEWVTVQLTSGAKKTLTTSELEKAIRKKIRHPELRIYYPVIEDRYGKQDSPYSEYIFITFHPDLDYFELEELEEFTKVLRTSPLGQDVHITFDTEIQEIRKQVCDLAQLNSGDVVKIMEGPLKGNFGIITGTYAGEATLLVTMGSESMQACISIQNLRFSRKRTAARRLKAQQFSILANMTSRILAVEPTQPLVLQVHLESTVELSTSEEESNRITRVIRRGLKNTRVEIGGQAVLLSNEELRKRLQSSDSVPEDN